MSAQSVECINGFCLPRVDSTIGNLKKTRRIKQEKTADATAGGVSYITRIIATIMMLRIRAANRPTSRYFIIEHSAYL